MLHCSIRRSALSSDPQHKDDIMLTFLTAWNTRRTAARELSRLSDRSLEDLGIARHEIRSVVTRAAVSASDHKVAAPQQDGFDRLAPSWAVHNRRSIAA